MNNMKLNKWQINGVARHFLPSSLERTGCLRLYATTHTIVCNLNQLTVLHTPCSLTFVISFTEEVTKLSTTIFGKISLAVNSLQSETQWLFL